MERYPSGIQRFSEYITHFNHLVDRMIQVRQVDALTRRRAELLNLSLLVIAGVVLLLWGADVWDSLSTDRAYRLGWLKPQVKAYMPSEGGRHFDPMVVEAPTHLPIWSS